MVSIKLGFFWAIHSGSELFRGPTKWWDWKLLVFRFPLYHQFVLKRDERKVPCGILSLCSSRTRPSADSLLTLTAFGSFNARLLITQSSHNQHPGKGSTGFPGIFPFDQADQVFWIQGSHEFSLLDPGLHGPLQPRGRSDAGLPHRGGSEPPEARAMGGGGPMPRSS